MALSETAAQKLQVIEDKSNSLVLVVKPLDDQIKALENQLVDLRNQRDVTSGQAKNDLSSALSDFFRQVAQEHNVTVVTLNLSPN